MQFTEPLDVPVVRPDHNPQSVAPMRTSLPSMFPPDWVTDNDWLTPNDVSFGLPFCSAKIEKLANTTNNPAITTVRQPLKKMGEIAARTLLNQIENAEPRVPEITIEPEFVVRSSTAPARPTNSPGGRASRL